MHLYLSSPTPNADRFEKICNAPYQPQQGGLMIQPHTSVSYPYNPHSNFVAPVQNVGCSGSTCPVGTYRTDSNQPQPIYSSSNNWFNGN